MKLTTQLGAMDEDRVFKAEEDLEDTSGGSRSRTGKGKVNRRGL